MFGTPFRIGGARAPSAGTIWRDCLPPRLLLEDVKEGETLPDAGVVHYAGLDYHVVDIRWVLLHCPA